METVARPQTQVDEQDLVEARALNAQIEAALAAVPSIHTLTPEVIRQARRDGKGAFPPLVYLDEAQDIEVAGRAGPIKVRVVRPAQPASGIYLHIHGGGWTLGAWDMQDVLLKAVAGGTGLCAVSIDYRLAPEHPYPAGPDDCEDAVDHLLEHGPKLFDSPAHFAIGGESAGAHLAVVTLLRLRDRHGIRGRIAGANLVYGAYDLSLTPSQRLWGDRNLILSGPIIRWFGDGFTSNRSLDARRDPDISPLYADLSDMPPALFTVGTLDPLLDDSLFMEARWRQAGHRTELAVYPEAIHGFTAFPYGLARKANERQLEFLRGLAGT
ncbi:MAG: alpha/beta hydrolase [Candidatus Dormibacteraceae bacterium]